MEKRAGIREAVWRGQSHHAFRKGFVTELKRAEADVDTVEHLVGHKLPGLHSAYTDPTGLPMRETVRLIPPLGGAQLYRWIANESGTS